MKNKGFTLIELLAVIVVLAIIALIATPIVMNTINRSKKGAAERSADNYIDAVETAVATKHLDETILDGEYIIQPDGSLCPTSGCGENDKDKVIIEMEGNKPTGGTIIISNGQVTTDSTMTIGGYDVKYNEDNKKYEATEKESSSSTVVYRWSEDGIKIGDTIDPSDTTKYTKDPSTLGKNYYLKHVLDKDNKVTESYACAIFNSKEYCLRGGDSSFYGYAENEADYTGNMLILKGLRDTGLSCDFGSGVCKCNESSVGWGINLLYDVVFSTGNDAGCFINADGYSLCGD